jgi:hypothetical protein
MYTFTTEYNLETEASLVRCLNKAGGSSNHLELFKILFTPTFPKTRKGVVYKDSRAGYSLLSLIGYPLTLPIGIALYLEELRVAQLYNLNTNYIKPPHYYIDIQNKITGYTMGFYNLKLFLNGEFKELGYLLDLPPEYFEVGMPFALRLKTYDINLPANLVNICETNNRIEAAVLLGKWLQYPQPCINLLKNVSIEWHNSLYSI